ncbi:MAG: hypothetical protein ACRD1T_04495, partial [Acidimicrobiia bacterium]
MKPNTASRRTWSFRYLVWLLVPLFVVGMVATHVVERASGYEQNLIESVSLSMGFGWFVVLGALIVSRQPKNPMGWILAAIGSIVAVFPAGNALANYIVSQGGHASLWVRLVAWPNNWYWYVLLALVMVYTPL